MANDALSGLKFNDGNNSGGFIKFEKGKSVKLRVYTTNPVVNLDNYGNTRYSFVVWDYAEGKAKILSKGASIARPLVELHTDEDFGADITKQDIKINAVSTGSEAKDVEYTINVLPNPNSLLSEVTEELKKLEEKLDTIIKGGVRADKYNDGAQPQSEEAEVKAVDIDNIAPEEEVDLSSIPF